MILKYVAGDSFLVFDGQLQGQMRAFRKTNKQNKYFDQIYSMRYVHT